MQWFNKLWGRLLTSGSAQQELSPEQKLMSLEERMAFRREMVFGAVREVLSNHHLPPLSYKLNVARLDARGHRYAVMIDLVPQLAGRLSESPGEWQAMESQAMHIALERYRIRIANLYWRLEPSGFGSVHENALQEESPARRWRALEEAAAKEAAMMGSTQSVVAQSVGDQDEFPDTLVEARQPVFEMITEAERLAFETAMKDLATAKQPVHLGSKTYQTDFMPLV